MVLGKNEIKGKNRLFLQFFLILHFYFHGQIRFILLQNRQGKTRLAKYYIPLEESEKHKVEYEVKFVFDLVFFVSWSKNLGF